METIYVGGEVPVSSIPKLEPTETSKVTRTKKSVNIEEIVKLKLDIESIDLLMEEKEQKISKNKSKWYCRYGGTLCLILVLMITMAILCGLSAISLPLLSQLFSSHMVEGAPMILASMSMIGSVGAIFSYVPYSLMKRRETETNTLHGEIDTLNEIKKQKTSELELIIKQVNNAPSSLVSTQSTVLNKIKIYQEVLKVVQSITITPTPEVIKEVTKSVEEIEETVKQKTLTNP